VVPLFKGHPPALTFTVSVAVAVAAVAVVVVVVVTVAVAPAVCIPFDAAVGAAVGAEDSSAEQLGGCTLISRPCSSFRMNIPLRNIFFAGHNTRCNPTSHSAPNQERQYRDSKPK
jgi:hypothetical protein